jgi:hypothetical protein
MSDTPETDSELHGIKAVCKDEYMLDQMVEFARKLERERDEAVAARKASAADWLLQVENADKRVSEAKKMAARAVQDAAQLADKLSGLELRSTDELARLERERNEARAVADELASVAAHCLGWHDHESPDAAIKIAAALKRWKKSK